MKRYLFFSAIKEVDLPNINPISDPYQTILEENIKQAREEVMTLSDAWIISYNGEDNVI